MGARAPTDTVGPAALGTLFFERFGSPARLFRAPGRINIVGEHTDYSEGFALPAAIDRFCTVAAAPNKIGALRLFSMNLDEAVERPAHTFVRRGDWSDYVAGVAAALHADGALACGWDMVLYSDVPLGGGVSSSAALTVATTLAMTHADANAVAPERVRQIAWTAENQFAGMPCGPLDQFASVYGKRGHALLMDCRTLTAEPVALPNDAAFLLINSGVKHALVDGGYEQRRRECEAAAASLGLKALRDADLHRVAALEGTLRRRARHVVSENARVGAVAEALRRADLAMAGRLIAQSHESLRADFDVTCAETDSLATIASETPGVFGARQMGGGFGGCVIALVAADRALQAGQHIADAYRRQWNTGGDWFVCQAADGAGELTL